MTAKSEQILKTFDKKRRTVTLAIAGVSFVLLSIAVGFMINNNFGFAPNILILIACLMNLTVGLSVNFFFQPRANAAASEAEAQEAVAAR